jgi:hypothetical protein
MSSHGGLKKVLKDTFKLALGNKIFENLKKKEEIELRRR